MAATNYTFKPEDFMKADAFKSFFGNSGVNLEDFAATGRRNMEVFTAASREAAEAARALAQSQTAYARQTMEDLAAYWRDLMSSGSDMSEKAEIQSHAARDGFAKAMAHNKEVTEIIQKSQEKLMRTMNDQIAENVEIVTKRAKEGKK